MKIVLSTHAKDELRKRFKLRGAAAVRRVEEMLGAAGYEGFGRRRGEFVRHADALLLIAHKGEVILVVSVFPPHWRTSRVAGDYLIAVQPDRANPDDLVRLRSRWSHVGG